MAQKFTQEQAVQEEAYFFPYHYLDIKVEWQRHFGTSFEYLCRIDEIKRVLQPLKGKTILDAGCGDGRLCYEFKNEGCTIVGNDYSEQAVAFARAFNPEVTFYVQELEHLDVPMKFDAIVLQETLEHIIPEQIPNVLAGIAKVLKDDGKFIITVPSDRFPVSSKHYQHFSPESLTEAVKSHFKVETIIGMGKIGPQNKYYSLMKKFGLLFYPFRKKFAFARKYFEKMHDYYRKNILNGPAAESGGLLAICVKK